MTSTLPLSSNSTYTPPPHVNSMSLQTLPSPPAHEGEISKTNLDVANHNGSSSILAARRQNVSLPAFTFPSPSQRTFGYGLHSPASSLLTPPSGNDHMSPVDSNSSVNTSFWAPTAPSHTPSSSYPYGSGASSQSAYSTAPSLAASPAYAARGIVSPVSTSSRSQPLSPNHQEPVSSATQPSAFDTAHYNSNLSVPVTHGQSYTNNFSYSQQGQMTSAGPNPLSSPHESYPTPSSLPPPTPSSGYYTQHSPPYSYHGHPMSVPQTSPSIARPSTAGSLSHLHPLHASSPLTHTGYHQPAHQRYLPNGLATNMYAQHGASIMSGLPPHLAGSLPQHAHIHPSQHAAVPHQERPFRCDQCPQSFNRNHDLKRHKRIHLAVKPFPCPNCDKSFSRKDALKRHVLVKGCGSTSAASKPTSTA